MLCMVEQVTEMAGFVSAMCCAFLCWWILDKVGLLSMAKITFDVKQL